MLPLPPRQSVLLVTGEEVELDRGHVCERTISSHGVKSIVAEAGRFWSDSLVEAHGINRVLITSCKVRGPCSVS